MEKTLYQIEITQGENSTRVFIKSEIFADFFKMTDSILIDRYYEPDFGLRINENRLWARRWAGNIKSYKPNLGLLCRMDIGSGYSFDITDPITRSEIKFFLKTLKETAQRCYRTRMHKVFITQEYFESIDLYNQEVLV